MSTPPARQLRHPLPAATRRAFLRTALLGGAGAGMLAATGCGSPMNGAGPAATGGVATTSATGTVEDAASVRPDTPTTGATLVAYFSRPGENYWYGDRRTLTVGNTEVLVTMLVERTGWDVHRIEAAEPYPDDYDDTVARNAREQETDARPRMVSAVPDLSACGTVVLASPIWNLRPPMVMSTFVEAAGLQGKRLLPVTTHAMSGLGRSVEVYTALAPEAILDEGLAVQGEEVPGAGDQIDDWLERVSGG